MASKHKRLDCLYICLQCKVSYHPLTISSKWCSHSCSAKWKHANGYMPPPKPFPIRRGSEHHGWRGGRRVMQDGYVSVMIPQPQGRSISKLEHRVIMAQHLKRDLLPNENIHHKNGIRHDNRVENLELWKTHQPPGSRATEFRHCETCSCGELP